MTYGLDTDFLVACEIVDHPFHQSAGAMALSEKVVLFHDFPPQGAGNAEVFDAGLSAFRGLIVFPDADKRLALGDKQRVSMLASRLEATRTIVEAISSAKEPPRVLINASAVGFYGDRGDEILDEGSSRGEGFLAELSRDWETAALAAGSDRTRVVLLRLGMVVARGGALSRMLTPFKMGLGGPVGSGRQFWPWVGIKDVGIAWADGQDLFLYEKPEETKEFATEAAQELAEDVAELAKDDVSS